MKLEQYQNMMRHADFMEKVVPFEEPKGKTLDMKSFVILNEGEDNEHEFGKPNDFLEANPCGFAACAIGWAVCNPKIPQPNVCENWEDYSRRIFGVNTMDAGSYCFSGLLPSDDIKDIARRMRQVAKEQYFDDTESL